MNSHVARLTKAQQVLWNNGNCPACCKPIRCFRTNVVFCSPRCKQKAYRDRKRAEKAAAPIEASLRRALRSGEILLKRNGGSADSAERQEGG